MTEPVLPTAPEGYRFGTVTFVPASGIATLADENGATASVETDNTLLQNFGSLALTKVLTGGPTGYNGPFDIVWDCGGTHAGTACLTAGQTLTVDDAGSRSRELHRDRAGPADRT